MDNLREDKSHISNLSDLLNKDDKDLGNTRLASHDKSDGQFKEEEQPPPDRKQRPEETKA